MTRYQQYLDGELASFLATPGRAAAAQTATADLRLSRVLDVGCGAGQELLPFLRPGVRAIGIDLAPTVGHHGLVPATFLRAAATAIPCRDGSLDLAICRLALPYTHNPTALAEVARVLRPGGRVFLKWHHVRFYVRQLRRGPSWKPRLVALRVLTASAWYHMTGQHWQNRLFGRETAQTRWLLTRELARCGLRPIGILPDDNPHTPSWILAKPDHHYAPV
jgi:SAM-dependent methyltransferase